eukprot:Gb_34865 [translate_table: standard]
MTDWYSPMPLPYHSAYLHLYIMYIGHKKCIDVDLGLSSIHWLDSPRVSEGMVEYIDDMYGGTTYGTTNIIGALKGTTAVDGPYILGKALMGLLMLHASMDLLHTKDTSQIHWPTYTKYTMLRTRDRILQEETQRIVGRLTGVSEKILDEAPFGEATVDECKGLVHSSPFSSSEVSPLAVKYAIKVNKHNKEVVLEQAEKDLSSVTAEYMSRVAKELQGDDFWKLRRAYSPGVQEYVEAATVIEFCKTGRLLTLADLNNDLSELSNLPTNSFKINLLDYLLGVGDLTGELMRLAISHVADGEVEVAKTICNFVRDLYKELSLVAPDMDDNSEMNKKMDTMLQSLVKIENVMDSPLLDNQAFCRDLLMPPKEQNLGPISHEEQYQNRNQTKETGAQNTNTVNSGKKKPEKGKPKAAMETAATDPGTPLKGSKETLRPQTSSCIGGIKVEPVIEEIKSTQQLEVVEGDPPIIVFYKF